MPTTLSQRRKPDASFGSLLWVVGPIALGALALLFALESPVASDPMRDTAFADGLFP